MHSPYEPEALEVIAPKGTSEAVKHRKKLLQMKGDPECAADRRRVVVKADLPAPLSLRVYQRIEGYRFPGSDRRPVVRPNWV